MLKLTKPRLRRSNVVLDSFGSCIPNTAEKFSRTPEVSVPEMVSQPRMLLHQPESTVSFEQLQSFANTHSDGHLNKERDMVNSDVEFINFEPFSVSNLPQEKLTIHSEPIELKRILSIFNFPDKVESILSEAMFSRFQIHFLSPQTFIRNKVPTMFDCFSSRGLVSSPSSTNSSHELNLMEGGDSSQNLKVWVPSPRM